MSVSAQQSAPPAADPARMHPELRSRLRAAVQEAFSREDFHNVDMRGIAARSGMSFSTIYKYFGDKEHLLFEFISEWLAELRERIVDGMQGLESPREKLRRFLWVNLQFFEDNPGVARVMFMSVPLQTWMRDSTFRQAEFFEPIIALVRDAQQARQIDPELQPHQVIDFFMGTIQHSIVMWEYRNRRYRLTGQFEPMFRVLWGGIRAA
jgi:AcrR family transcriptional regulator